MSINNNQNTKVKYIFIGNALNQKTIGENSLKVNSVWAETAQKIFREYCKNIENKYEKHNKIVSEDGIYYCTISPSNIFYLALISENYPERRVFQMIDEFKKDNIHLLVDEKGELNKPGKQALKSIVQQYENEKDKISEINGDINEIKIEMHNNVKRVLANTEDLQSLDAKANKIKDNANIFKKDATNLKRKTFWQNCKWTIIMVSVVIALLLIIVVPLVVNNSSSNNDQNSNNNNQNESKNEPKVRSTVDPPLNQNTNNLNNFTNLNNIENNYTKNNTTSMMFLN